MQGQYQGLGGIPRFLVRVGVFIKVAFLLVRVPVVLSVVVQILPDEPANIPFLSAAEVYHLLQSDCANDVAPENIFFILITLETSHLEMSQLNDTAE